jgi:hypothetical protein
MRRIQEIYRRNFCQRIQRFYKKRLEQKNEEYLKEERMLRDCRRSLITFNISNEFLI